MSASVIVLSSCREFALQLHHPSRLGQRNSAEPNFLANPEARAIAAGVECVSGRGDAIKTAKLVAEPVEPDDPARFDSRIADATARAGQAIVQTRKQLGQNA